MSNDPGVSAACPTCGENIAPLLNVVHRCVVLEDGCVGGHHPDLVSCALGSEWP